MAIGSLVPGGGNPANGQGGGRNMFLGGGGGGGLGRGARGQLEMENTTVDFSSEAERENSCPDGSSERKFAEPDPEEAWKKGVIRR